MESQLNYYHHNNGVQDMGRNNQSSQEILPYFEGHQLIGDSLFVRFANEVLNQPNKIVNGIRLVGYCVSGQRIDQLRQRIKKKEYRLAPRVIVLIGTNDVLCGRDTDTMIRHFKRLLKLLLKDVKKLVILTLPPIPKLCVSFSHWAVIRTYNSYLLGLQNGSNISVLDTCRLYTKFAEALKFTITEKNPFIQNPSMRRTDSLDRQIDSPATSRSRSSSSSLERKKSPVSTPVEKKLPVNPIERSLEPKEKRLHDLLNRMHRSRKPPETRKSEEMEEKKKDIKVNRRVELLENVSSDSDEDMNDSELCVHSPDVSNVEILQEEKITEEETPVKKGIKRTIRIADDDDDDENVAFNNIDDDSLISEGGPCSKKRKVEISKSDPKSLSPSRAQRNLINSQKASATIFSRALMGIGEQPKKSNSVSPKKLSPKSPSPKNLNKLSIKAEKIEDSNEELTKPVIATDNWKVENLDESIEDIAYNSQEEEETKPVVEECDEKVASLRASFKKKLSPSVYEKHFPQQSFKEYLIMSNEPDSSDLQEERFSKIKTENNNIEIFKGEEISEEEGEIKMEDISDGEIFDDDDDDDDDDYNRDTNEAESETSDDQSHQKQLWPIIDFQFATFVKNSLNLVSTLEGSTEVIMHHRYLEQSYIQSQAPTYNQASFPPLGTPPPSHYYNNSPYSQYYTPPSSAPSTPTPMTPNYENKNSAANESSSTGKLDLEGLLPRDKNIIELSRHIVDLDCYEVMYSFGQKRLDMIHLNYYGLSRLRDFLSTKLNY